MHRCTVPIQSKRTAFNPNGNWGSYGARAAAFKADDTFDADLWIHFVSFRFILISFLFIETLTTHTDHFNPYSHPVFL